MDKKTRPPAPRAPGLPLRRPHVSIAPDGAGLAVVLRSANGWAATVWRGADPLAAKAAAVRWSNPGAASREMGGI